MALTFPTLRATAVAGAYASVANASYNAGGGSFASVAGRFGGGGLIVNGKVDRTTVSKELAIAQLATGVTFTKRPVSNQSVAGTAQQIANATTYAPTTVVITGLFGGQGVFGNASLLPVIPSSAKATTVMYFGAPVGCPINTSPSTASYAFWS